MTAPAQFSIYCGRCFMGSFGVNAAGSWMARGQDHKSLGTFRAKKEAVAAIVSRYAAPQDEREARQGSTSADSAFAESTAEATGRPV